MKSSFLRYLQPGQVWQARNGKLFLILSIGVDRAYENEVDIRILDLESGKPTSFARSVWETTADIGWMAFS